AIAFGPGFTHLGLPTRLATSAATAATTPVAAKPAAAAEATFRFRAGLVHRQRASAHLELVEFRGSLLRFLVRRHLDEREAAGTARRSVAHHSDGLDVARLTEQFL